MKDKVIIYDDNCPMCCAYTGAFIKMGLLEEEGRVPFSELEESGLSCQLDLYRSRHEIPLVDKNQESTLYGLDSMLTILAQKIPFLVKIARFKPFYFCLEQFYKFISYNRKIIAAKTPKPNVYDCSPDFHSGYRLAYLLFAFGLSLLIFSQVFFQVPEPIWVLGGLFTSISLLSFRKNLWDWMGHLGTSFLIGALFLTLFLWIPQIPLTVLIVSSIGMILYQLIHRIRVLGYLNSEY